MCLFICPHYWFVYLFCFFPSPVYPPVWLWCMWCDVMCCVCLFARSWKPPVTCLMLKKCVCACIERIPYRDTPKISHWNACWHHWFCFSVTKRYLVLRYINGCDQLNSMFHNLIIWSIHLIRLSFNRYKCNILYLIFEVSFHFEILNVIKCICRFVSIFSCCWDNCSLMWCLFSICYMPQLFVWQLT